MNTVEAARRLGVHETQVRSVQVHPAGFVVSLRSGPQMLISETVARVYVPEVDDAPEVTPEPVAAEKPKKAVAKKATPGGSAS